MSSDWTEFFERAGAIWRHHPGGPHARHRLTEHHSAYYLNTDVICEMGEVVGEFSRRLSQFDPEWIVAPRTSILAGAKLARAVATVRSCASAEYDVNQKHFSNEIPRGARVAVVTDDIHGGGSARSTIVALRSGGVKLVGPLLTLANFSTLTELADIPIEALVTHSFDKWLPIDCPLCREGSSAVDARDQWATLTST